MGEFFWCEVADRKAQIKSSDSKKFHDKCQQNDHMHASWEKVRNESQRDRAMMELPMADPPTTQPMSDLPTDVSVPVTALEDFEDTRHSLRRYFDGAEGDFAMASQLASDYWVAPEHMCCRLREEEAPTDAGFHEMDVDDVGYRTGYSLLPERTKGPQVNPRVWRCVARDAADSVQVFWPGRRSPAPSFPRSAIVEQGFHYAQMNAEYWRTNQPGESLKRQPHTVSITRTTALTLA